MKSFETSINIACPGADIWAVLTDATTYPEWAAGTHRLDGEIVHGGVLKLFTVSKPRQPMILRVTALAAPSTFTLSGGLPFGLFRGDRTFTLTPKPDGSTQFHMREVFTGLLEPLIGRMLPDLTPSFEAYAAGLKQKCEGQ
ncbi:SRPBCC domain-containing protein [Leptothoe kymatousa]|uniref:SRPBCC domain-containing protein n=1 Tax=Leptothoe kymatousa TAU-MAC 1615 TaxID=2364775 RepID=A0ABS5XYH4_9CYAN|nr:SRPBCC domain-containing protein [Leptothoe kymatousa]MBT9310689.1 SRPBCC domain-containing protein [Leptothoe kymatousa TAU-MAC 1615]